MQLKLNKNINKYLENLCFKTELKEKLNKRFLIL